MLRTLSLLLAVAVLWCGLDFCAPAMAHAAPSAQIEALHDHAPGERSHGEAPGSAHGGHHHCPVAPDAQAPCHIEGPTRAAGLFAPAHAAAMTSRAQAPPIQPPSA